MFVLFGVINGFIQLNQALTSFYNHDKSAQVTLGLGGGVILQTALAWASEMRYWARGGEGHSPLWKLLRDTTGNCAQGIGKRRERHHEKTEARNHEWEHPSHAPYLLAF